ncbi:hypothetical protein [Erwinia billingiae]|uniref:hypothetical protein n=1 Tax=Erwinia billingiae TaxID=182337 RepID=UPI001C61376B|nr:hypothetical protein [Erwinia billingiae]
MWNKEKSVSYLNSHVEHHSLGKCAEYVRKAVESGGVTVQIPSPRIGNSASACDYGPSLVAVGFKAVYTYTGSGPTDTAIISGQQAGDVVVIQPIVGHPHGHIALFNGRNWVSDFLQLNGFYPGKLYRNIKPAYILYRYGAEEATAKTSSDKTQLKKICYPVAKLNGQEFTQQEDMLAHLAGESTGLYMIGRNGMWHGGIHFTNATTPWCALSGNTTSEKIDFPLAFKGEQAVRCMVDGEVVAYRICKDYLQIPWESGPLYCSGSFVLIRHYIQPGETKKSGLNFYTLYIHLAPYSAYEAQQDDNLWSVQERLAAYEPDWVMVAGSENKTVRDSYRKGTVPKGAIIEWDPADTNLHATAYNLRGYGLVTFKGLSAELQKKGVKTSLTPGQRYWMLVDRTNIAPATVGGKRPSWWKALLPPAREVMQFDQVVCPTPYAIGAGDSVGHLGYFQVAKDGGYEARYQVHIECISMDDNLPNFLKNPEQVGAKNPLWLKYPPGLELYEKDAKTGRFNKNGRVTSRSGILKLSKVPSENDKLSKQEYWHLSHENGYVLKGENDPELLSPYDFAKLGFKTEISEPTSFDYLNGNTQPAGLLRNVFQSLLDVAKKDSKFSNALAPYNYQRILNKIDSGGKGYSPMEYFRALQNPSYRDVVMKTIVKHPSDWYHTKSDALWQAFLEPLKKEAPEWKKYSEAFLDKMTWMQDLSTVKLGPSLWHMHPVMFLGGLMKKDKIIWMKKFTNIFGIKISEAFRAKLLEVSESLGIDPNYIMACIALETDKKFRTDTKNPGSSATGLIQFMKATAKELGTTTKKLSEMDHVEQMEYVKKYFEMQARNFGMPTNKWTLEDVYYSIFSPKTIKLGLNDIVYKKSNGNTYNRNLFHDKNKDGIITKSEIAENIRIFYKLGMHEEG